MYRDSKYGKLIFVSAATTCPNQDCKEISIVAGLHKSIHNNNGPDRLGDKLHGWSLLPEANVKVFPDYIPAQLKANYREACIIVEKSPKASATLARRCLQGMIRDFWQISKRTLKEEIDAIQEKVDPVTWSAIDAIRKIGNIGAHMEKDIDLIIDVTEEEANLLIQLIEILFNDWYVVRFDREQRLKKIISASEEKEEKRAKKS